MVELEILSGNMAGVRWAARHFPVRIGRSPGSDLQLEEQGVWDDHAWITLSPEIGFVLEAQPQASVLANNQPVQKTTLRNGDKIDIGSVKLQFWLSEAQQGGLKFQEGFVWAIVIAVSLGQIALIYWLIR